MTVYALLERSLPAQVRDRLDLLDSEYVTTTRNGLVEARRGRFERLELRRSGDKVSLAGYATTWNTSYPVAGGPPYGWNESIASGAVTKSLKERDDVRFLVNHEGVPLARTKSGTLRLSTDSTGFLCEIDSLDMSNPTAVELVSALDRGDIDQMSWAFRAIRQEWNDDYTERTIVEAQVFDVSAVTYPANPATIVGLRSDDPPVSKTISLALASAMASALDL